MGASTGMVQAETATDFPSRPIKLVVPVGPGGIYDYLGRTLGDMLSKELKQPVVVENKTGAGSVVGTQYVVKSAPDGYTMVIGGVGSIAHSSALVKNLPYSPGKDLVPLQLAASNSYTLVSRPGFGPKNLQEVIAYAKNNPGKLTIASPGKGTGQTVAALMLKSLAGIDILEVQYKGASPAYIDLMAGRIDLFFDSTGTTAPYVQSGKIGAIASSGTSRDFPNVPTAAESGLKDMVLLNWTGLFAPAATPKPIVLRLRQAINKVVATDAFKEKLKARRLDGFSPDDVETFVQSEIKRWPAALAKAGVTAK
jgi:tripartite-type tricarboxylate transporter receptor subunit TctC